MIHKYLNKIIHGDCLKILKTIPDNSVDMTFADPPFNLNKKYNSYSDRRSLDTYLLWCKQWLAEIVRVTKTSGSIFVHNIPKWLTYYASFLNEIADFKHWISWDAMSRPLGKTLMPTHYGILFYAKDRKLNRFYEIRHPHKRCRKCNVLLKDYGGKKAGLHPFGPLISDVWTDLHRIKHAKNRDNHPCQLPETILERLILMTTDEGDIILDPFNGTGTTVIAAKRLGRKFVGIEIDKEYVAIAEEKLRIVRPDSHIDGVWISKYLNGIATIRDKDWNELQSHFEVPNPIPLLEYKTIIYKNGKICKHAQIPRKKIRHYAFSSSESMPCHEIAAKSAN